MTCFLILDMSPTVSLSKNKRRLVWLWQWPVIRARMQRNLFENLFNPLCNKLSALQPSVINRVQNHPYSSRLSLGSRRVIFTCSTPLGKDGINRKEEAEGAPLYPAPVGEKGQNRWHTLASARTSSHQRSRIHTKCLAAKEGTFGGGFFQPASYHKPANLVNTNHLLCFRLPNMSKPSVAFYVKRNLLDSRRHQLFIFGHIKCNIWQI